MTEKIYICGKKDENDEECGGTCKQYGKDHWEMIQCTKCGETYYKDFDYNDAERINQVNKDMRDIEDDDLEHKALMKDLGVRYKGGRG
jgi:hypothetical protein